MPTVYEKAAEALDKQVVAPFRQKIVGRQLFAKTVRLDPGKFEITYDTLTDMGQALIDYELPPDNAPADNIKISQTTLKLPVISHRYKIARSEWDAFNNNPDKYPLEPLAATSAGYGIAVKEDAVLVDGWKPDGTNYVAKGLYQAATNTEGTSSVTSTFGNTVIKLQLAMAVLETDFAADYNFNLVLAPGNYWEVITSYSATYGVKERPSVLEILNSQPGAPGRVIKGPNLTANTGLLVPVDPAGESLDLVIGRELRNTIAQPKFSDISPIEVALYEVLVPRIKRTDAICTLTGL